MASRFSVRKRGGAIAAIASGAVVDWNTEHGAGKDIATAADELAQWRPVGRAAAIDVARADDEIGVLRERQEVGQVFGIVRVVGVHLEDELVAVLDGIVKAEYVRGAQAHLAGAVQRADPRIRRADLVDELAGAVGRVIVDDQDVGLGREAQDVRDQAGDILALVIGRDDDQRPHALLLATYSGSS